MEFGRWLAELRRSLFPLTNSKVSAKISYQQMMQSQERLLHGLESREYKFIPKVLGVAMSVIEEEDDLTMQDFLGLVSDRKITNTSDDLEVVFQDQIKEDIRQHKWASLTDCGSSSIAIRVVLDLMRTFSAPTKSTLSHDLLNDAG